MKYIVVLLAVSAAAAAMAEDWPHWRGAQRSDIVKEDSGWNGGVWLPEAPLWTKKIGNGATSPLVVGNRLYTLGYAKGKDTVYCLDCGTGKELWTSSYACPEYGRHKNGDEGIYSGPNSTPEFDLETGYLYSLSTDGDLNCWDTKDKGGRVWGLNLYDTYGVAQRPKIGRLEGKHLFPLGQQSFDLVHRRAGLGGENELLGFVERHPREARKIEDAVAFDRPAPAALGAAADDFERLLGG